MNIEKIYELRKSYTVIALTGRTGSGCSEIADRLVQGFSDNDAVFRHPDLKNLEHNSNRKYRIVYDYCKENFKQHTLISYKDVLLLFILKKDFETFISFLSNSELKKEYQSSNLVHLSDFEYEINELKKFKKQFNSLHKKVVTATLRTSSFRTLSPQLTKTKKVFTSIEFKNFKDLFNSILASKSKVKRNKILQIVGNNIRKNGFYDDFTFTNLDNVYSICEIINDLVKAFTKENKIKKLNTEIVIDSLRNPLEIMYFRQRFSAYYTIAVNRDEKSRIDEIKKRYTKDSFKDISGLMSEEYKGGKSKEFYKQNVSQCIQSSDIHIAFKSYDEIDTLNKELLDKKDYSSPYFSWQMQLLKFLSLIDQPGIVTPSPEERCMQLAFTAKYNSGCISRQVGAAITDEFYSIKAIGWNNTPEGQVPCNLRNVDDLINMTGDLEAFTTYEKTNGKFRETLENNFVNNINLNSHNLKGRNVCFCFKSLINSYSDGKNQVHTRSLHAEESAFLQITKYGGQGILNGKLFTTASPCELCSKKAYQLGIKFIYYIDPYPGISYDQILTAGTKNPEMRLFHGAIGNAYHWLYEPFMAYKDELSLILEQNIKDLTSIKEDLLNNKRNELLSLKSDMYALVEENEKLKEIIASQKNTK
jgi:deoxycytidylate deaminase/dephospho-CoA kinase